MRKSERSTARSHHVATPSRPGRRPRASGPARNTVRRKKREAVKRAKRPAGWSWMGGARHSQASLPGWKDLAKARNERAPGRPRGSAYLERVSTTKFALLLLAVAAVFTFYVGHVHATQDLLARLQEARRENLRLHLKHNRLKGAFDQATGPAVIYERARALGLEEGIAYGPTIFEETP